MTRKSEPAARKRARVVGTKARKRNPTARAFFSFAGFLIVAMLFALSIYWLDALLAMSRNMILVPLCLSGILLFFVLRATDWLAMYRVRKHAHPPEGKNKAPRRVSWIPGMLTMSGLKEFSIYYGTTPRMKLRDVWRSPSWTRLDRVARVLTWMYMWVMFVVVWAYFLPGIWKG